MEVVYAKAIKDYANITDDSFLALRLGDIVLVSSQLYCKLNKHCLHWIAVSIAKCYNFLVFF